MEVAGHAPALLERDCPLHDREIGDRRHPNSPALVRHGAPRGGTVEVELPSRRTPMNSQRGRGSCAEAVGEPRVELGIDERLDRHPDESVRLVSEHRRERGVRADDDPVLADAALRPSSPRRGSRKRSSLSRSACSAAISCVISRTDDWISLASPSQDRAPAGSARAPRSPRRRASTARNRRCRISSVSKSESRSANSARSSGWTSSAIEMPASSSEV